MTSLNFALRSHPVWALVLALPVILPFSSNSRAEEPVDLDVVNRIRNEAFHRSQVMDLARHLADVIGPRVTGSPAAHEAQRWSLATMAEWGLEGERVPYEFGDGWDWQHCSVHMTSPRPAMLPAMPQGWTPGTDGPVKGSVVRLEAKEEEDLEELRGTLKGKILLIDEPRDVDLEAKRDLQRLDSDELAEQYDFQVPDGKPAEWRTKFKKRYLFRLVLNEFLVEEGALAVVGISSRDGGILRVGRGGSHRSGGARGVPAVGLSSEAYNRLVRLLDDGQEVELEINVKAKFHDNGGMGHNVVAEIPGGKKRDEVVMLGAHLDSYQSGDGATDNGGSCAVVMEAVRILRALDLPLARTVRVGLWTGEEQGLLGSTAYVGQTFASRPAPEVEGAELLSPGMYDKQWPIEYRPAHDRFSVYFNLDNGSGRIRGIYAEGNVAAGAVLESWLKPVHDLGATQVTLNGTTSTDHVPFNDVGLPAFQFIQDPMNYFALTHHSHLDTYDYLVPEDLKRSAAVLASLVYHAANRAEKMPRKPRPVAPPIADPAPSQEGDGAGVSTGASH